MSKTIEEFEAENAALKARVEELEVIVLSPEENKIHWDYVNYNIGADTPEFEAVVKKLMNFALPKEPK